MKILVIGGTGNIGLPLIQYLNQQAGVTVVAGAHNVAKDQRQLADYPDVELRPFDFLNAETFRPALQDVEKVFFVRPPQLAKPKEDMLPFLTCLKDQHIKQVVFVSLMGVEHNPMTPHHQIEKMIVELGLPYTFIRPSFFMQNLNTTHREDIQQNHDLFIPAGRAKTSFIDTRDIGEIAGVVLLNDQYLQQKLTVTGPAALTYQEIAAQMATIFGHPVTYSRPSLLKFRRVMLKRGLKKDYVNVMVMLYLITQLGNAKAVTTTAAEVLGRQPHDITTYLRDYIDELS
ncbi:SDR family oxidoreductase [Lactiplantibacillus pentosus]|uniref:NmrA-like domain-containing protein n=1 Tax=Lactiplantibacillus pentosus IG1 TaxID=1042160 RepID=G0M551_LACPE|nr:SDR family oxidoreductase [Lactiplantibacillus pentosus]CCC17362.1 putative uncharacterized protein lp_3343 [Lactiplantibacillus pentosus IG1]ASG80095.1 NAD(P)-dependent oxidoreductase [Lactiplantibacillus pentosus]MCT3284333.1 SDR family oxidoreductase [Lactiplantibacillus pentosus]MCT3303622.1 SDR family oxidoreductase [Lactiplantibacillus pentosus]PRO80774.1 SDR family NAD(P)-dependent oxidoreductase [Lactiplantibacillus pentosus]